MASLPIPRGANVGISAGGRYFPTPRAPFGPLGSPTRVVSGAHFVPRGNRFFGLTAEVDMGNLMSLGSRWEPVLHERLVHRLGEAAGIIIDRSKDKLTEGHGYDTGRMHDALHHVLVTGIERGIVAYDLEADPADAYYWVFVEFGHMTVAGNWWPGYYFLSSTLMENEALINAKSRQALAESVVVLSTQARLGGAMGRLTP